VPATRRYQRFSVSLFATKALEFCNGRLDVLINNAGLALGTEQIKDGILEIGKQCLIQTCLVSLMLVAKFVPAMIKQRSGHIVFIGSIAGHQVYEGGSAYCGSKHAVKAIARSLRLELNGTNIRVSSIDPGMTETEFSLVRLRNKEKQKQFTLD